MNEGATYDLNEIVDGQSFGAGSFLFLFVAALALISDGFGLSEIGYIAPGLGHEWGLDPARFAPVATAGIIGMFIGGPLFGVLGDRLGRKRLIIGGLAVIGAMTLACLRVQNIGQFMALWFVAGLGIGGVIPNVVALIAEATPRRIRGRLLIIVSMGIVTGIALAGLVVGKLVPVWGWRALLVVGGIMPLIAAIGTVLVAPESLKYLLVRGDRMAQVRRMAARLRPDLAIGETTRIVLPVATAGEGASFGQLFSGSLAVVTPLLWVCQATNQMANFFALTWLPQLLAAAGENSATTAMFAVGGMVSGLVLLAVIDRIGIVPLVAMFVLGCPLVATMVYPGLPPVAHKLIIAGAGFCVVGIQLGVTALLGMIYPTAVRSMGTGATQAAGRVGALLAPVVGLILYHFHVGKQAMTLPPAALLGVGAVACALLALQCWRHFGGLHVSEMAGLPARVRLAPAAARG